MMIGYHHHPQPQPIVVRGSNQQSSNHLSLFKLVSISIRFPTTTSGGKNRQISRKSCSRNIIRSNYNDVIVRSMTTTTTGNDTTSMIDDTNTNTNYRWKEKFISLSNIASILCVVDCTILPIISFILTLVGLLTFTSSQMISLHHLSHQISLYFVIPIGFISSSINYQYKHRKVSILSVAYIGVTLIALANIGGGTACSISTHHHHHQIVTEQFTMIPKSFLIMFRNVMNTIQHGVGHRITNIFGCSLLLLSNYISHKVSSSSHHHHVHGKECNH